jgi:endo-1,3(4)-beta-glucanase
MKKVLLFIIGASIVALSVFFYLQWRQATQVTKPFVSNDVLNMLPKKDASGIDTSHLVDGLTPPTNKWFSGIALQKVPKTVFPTPLSFTPTEASFSFSLPSTSTTASTIFSTQSDIASVEISQATHYRVTRYDDLSVDLTYRSDSKDLGVVTLVAGSPYLYFHALTDVKLAIRSTTLNVATLSSTIAAITGKTKMVAAGFNGAKMDQSDSYVTASLPKNGLTTFYSPPTGADDSLLTTAGNRITDTNVSYEKVGNDYQTTIKLQTDNEQPTYYGLLPHQNSDAPVVANYDTLYGRQRLIKGTEMSFSVPAVAIADGLNLSKVSADDRALLIDTLRREINATNITADDTYFDGKAMYRSAQLLALAKQLGEDNIADTIQLKLRTELTTWLSTTGIQATKFFYYDTKIHGIVGEVASFGSQEFNDHHFHYGYFIYAASILAKYDSDFLTQFAPMVNLLVADIANYRSDEQLPLRRYFDPYFGHSWASGGSPFNDGNNQESSSEAMNAWTAVGLWAAQIKDNSLAQEAGWMLAGETATTQKYWMNINTNEAPFNQVYAHSLVSLNWGGKRDYSTFFSSERNAMLGILLIPLNPTMVAQFASSDHISRHVTEAISQGNYNVQFGDFILMYDSLQKKEDYLEKAKSLPDEIIDGANSRSYMYAWIMSQK